MMMQGHLKEANEKVLGNKGWLRYVENSQNLNICQYFWPATTDCVKATVLLIHGHGSYLTFDYLQFTEYGKENKYESSWIQYLNEQGYSICGIDLQSHGRSESLNGYRCYFNKFDDLVSDIQDLAKWLKTEKDVEGFSNLPIFLLGGSLGGAIAVHAIYTEPELYEGAILIGPMLSLETLSKSGINPYLRPFGSFLSAWAPTLCCAAKKMNKKFPLIAKEYEEDNACFQSNSRARVAYEYLNETEYICKNMANMDFPFLCIHSKEDDFVDIHGPLLLQDQSKSKDKTLKIIDEMCHSLLKEPGHEKVKKMIYTWLEDRV